MLAEQRRLAEIKPFKLVERVVMAKYLMFSLLVVMPQVVHASMIIDFNSAVAQNQTSYNEDGFNLTVNVANHLETFGTGHPFAHGSPAAYNIGGNGLTTLTKIGGGSFELKSIDLSENLDSLSLAGRTVKFTGTKTDTSTVMQTHIITDGLSAFETFSFTGFTDLTSVTWNQSSTGGSYSFDNLVVPEPSTLAMFGIALAVMARRRR